MFDTTDDRPALVDADTGTVLTYRQLAAARSEVADRLAGERVLAAVYLDRSVAGLAAYASLVLNRCPVLVLDPLLPPAVRAGFEATFRPAVVLSAETGFVVPARDSRPSGGTPPHPDLALLLPTSGSTGRSKLVRLSRANLLSNAAAIVVSLGIGPGDVAITALPLSYSYGLSVVHSHLRAGASILVTAAALTDERFWRHLGGVTSWATTPGGWRLALGMGLERRELPALRYLTSAGGPLPPPVHRRLLDYSDANGIDFHQMYGQTEAAPRMTCMPASSARAKLGSVGVPLDGGRLSIRDDSSTEVDPGVPGSVWYSGPNVMMGYAEGPADLALGDVQGDWLRTGDRGRLDDDGFLWITGRDARFAKPYGIRVSLDEVELLLGDLGEVAAVAVDEVIHVFHTGPDFPMAAARDRLLSRLRLPAPAVVFHHLDVVPARPNGKPDLTALSALATDPGCAHADART